MKTIETQAPLELVLSRLEGVHKLGDGYQARCPAHDDQKASLSVREASDGKILVCCHAGCPTEAVLQKVGLAMKDLFPAKEKESLTEVATYDYVDEGGRLLFQAVRYRPKTFRQRRPDGQGGWIYNLQDTKRVLYRLPEVIKAIAAGERVWVVEGEKDCERLVGLGLVATTNPMGAGKWRSAYSERLRGAKVVIIPDNDDPGCKHAETVARSLRGVATSVKVLTLPGLPQKGDVSDFLAAGGDKERLLKLAAEAPEWSPPPEAAEPSSRPGSEAREADAKEKRAQADLLIEAADAAALFHDEQGEPCALVPVGDHQETYRMAERSFRRWLIGRVYRATGKAPNPDAVKQATAVLEAQAVFDGPRHELSLRVAGDGCREVHYDLGDETWQAITVTAEGWSCGPRPFTFRRGANTAAQVHPVQGGDLRRVLDFVNLPTKDAQILLLVYLVTALVPGIPHVVPVISGDKGAAKSTLTRVIRRLVDPADEELLAMPRDENEFALVLARNYVASFDNLDGLQAWQSDMLSRGVTGSGVIRRRLYTDDEEVILKFKRCVVLNGVNAATTRPDLLDRTIPFHLERIPPNRRREETGFWREFETVRPMLFGAMLDALSGAIRLYPTVNLVELPRMADFSRWGFAAAEALGIGGQAFLDAYWRAIGLQNEAAIQAHPVASAVVALLDNQPEAHWQGTMAGLLTVLESVADEERIDRRSKGWPGAAHILARRLNEVRSNLADAGIEIKEDREDSPKRTRRVSLRNVCKVASVASMASEPNDDKACALDAIRTLPESTISSVQESKTVLGRYLDQPAVVSKIASTEKTSVMGLVDTADATDATLRTLEEGTV